MSKDDIRLNIPNLISLARLFSVPITVWLLIHAYYQAAFWILLLACLSDAADGFIAKQFNLQTELGGYLDPIADKALLVSVFVTLALNGQIYIWLAILVVFRDALIVLGVILYQFLYQRLSMRPLLSSKINTTAQFALSALVMALAAFEYAAPLAVFWLSVVVAATTVWSGASYVFAWGRSVYAMEPGE